MAGQKCLCRRYPVRQSQCESEALLCVLDAVPNKIDGELGGGARGALDLAVDGGCCLCQCVNARDNVGAWEYRCNMPEEATCADGVLGTQTVRGRRR